MHHLRPFSSFLFAFLVLLPGLGGSASAHEVTVLPVNDDVVPIVLADPHVALSSSDEEPEFDFDSDPQTVDFGELPEGEPLTGHLEVENVSEEAQAVLIALAGDDGDVALGAGDADFVLAAGEARTVEITWESSTPKGLSAMMSLAATDSSGYSEIHDFDLLGVVLPPAELVLEEFFVPLEVTSVDHGEIVVGETSLIRYVLRNVGEGPTVDGEVSLPGQAAANCAPASDICIQQEVGSGQWQPLDTFILGPAGSEDDALAVGFGWTPSSQGPLAPPSSTVEFSGGLEVLSIDQTGHANSTIEPVIQLLDDQQDVVLNSMLLDAADRNGTETLVRNFRMKNLGDAQLVGQALGLDSTSCIDDGFFNKCFYSSAGEPLSQYVLQAGEVKDAVVYWHDSPEEVADSTTSLWFTNSIEVPDPQLAPLTVYTKAVGGNSDDGGSNPSGGNGEVAFPNEFGGARGLINQNSFFSDLNIDSVNKMNGNLVAGIPLGTSWQVGPNFSYGLTATYNSAAWLARRGGDFGQPNSLVTQAMTTIPAVNNSGLGWNISLGGELYVAKDKFAPGELAEIPEGWPVNRDSLSIDDWVYVDATGGRHAFRGAGTMHSRDGSYLRLREVSSTQVSIDLPNGQTQQFEHFVGGHCPIPGPAPKGCWRLKKISDPFGNFVHLDHTSTQTIITDSHTDSGSASDRRITVEYTTLDTGGEGFQTWATRHITEIEFPSTNGPVTWDLVLDPVTITRACPMDEDHWREFNSADMDITVHLLDRIDLPAGNGSWDFEYEDSHLPPSDGCNPDGGFLTKVTSPLGGSIEYTYRNVFMPIHCSSASSAPPDTSELQGVGTRIVRSADLERQSHQIFWYQGVDRNTEGDDCSRYNTMETHVVEHVPFGGDQAADHHYRHEVHFHNVTKAVGPTGVDNPPGVEWSHRDFGLPIAKSRSLPSNFDAQPELHLSSVVLDCDTKGLFTYEPGLATPNIPASCDVHRETYVRHTYSTSAASCSDNASQFGACVFRARPVSGRLHRYFRNSAVHEYSEDLYSEYDGFGNFRRKTTKSNIGTALETVNYTHTYAINSAGNPIEEIATIGGDPTTFDSMPTQGSVGPWLFGLYANKQSDPDGKVRRKDYSFDERGFLECSQTYANLFDEISTDASASQDDASPSDATVSYQEVSDGKGWVELEAFALGSGDVGCSGAPEYRLKHEYAYGQRTWSAFVNSAEQPVAPPTLDTEPEPATGWITETCDHSMSDPLCTSTTFDALGRPTMQTTGGRALDRDLIYSIDSDADGGGRILVTTRDATNSDAGSNLVGEVELVYDSIGREQEVYHAISEARSDPRVADAAADRIIQRKGYQRGRLDYVTGVYDESLWSAMNNSSRQATRYQYEEYDIHDRILGVHNPKGEYADFLYLQGAVSQQVVITPFGTPAGIPDVVRADTISDRLGRPVRIDEGIIDNDVQNPGRRTTFTYSNGVETATRYGQHRIRQLDGRGLVVWELIPEKIDLNEDEELARVRYTYDSRGNVLRSEDNGVDLEFSYDVAGRLETVHETSAQERLLEERFYDPISQGGRLDRSVRYNYYRGEETGGYADALIPVADGEILLLEIHDDFEYDDRGNVESKTTRVIRSYLNEMYQEVGGVNTLIDTIASWTYDGAGRPVTATYPSAAAFEGLKDLRLQFAYDVGELVQVLVSDVDLADPPVYLPLLEYTYHPSGSIHYRYRYDLAGELAGWDEISEFVYSPGTPGSLSNPDLTLPRVGQIDVTGLQSDIEFGVWSSGPYDYDGRGQIREIDGTTYKYDEYRRLLQVGSGSNFIYDAFDNLTGGGGMQPFSVDSGNNRLSTALGAALPVEYDSRGNMTGGGCPSAGFCAMNSRYDAYGRQSGFWWNLNSDTDHDGDGDGPGATPRIDVTDWDQQAIYAYSAAGERVFMFSRLPEDLGYSTPTGVVDPDPCDPEAGDDPDGCLADDFSEAIFTFFGAGGPMREFRLSDEVTSTSRNDAKGIRSYIGKEAILREGTNGSGVLPYTLKHLTSDHLGSVRISRRFLESGAVGGFARDDFSPWGHLEDSEIGESFGYAGHMMDRNGTNGDPAGTPGALYPVPRDGEWYTVNMNARTYLSEFGRFVSPDPARSTGVWSLYAYAANDPINKIDPTGLLETDDEDRQGNSTATVDGGGGAREYTDRQLEQLQKVGVDIESLSQMEALVSNVYMRADGTTVTPDTYEMGDSGFADYVNSMQVLPENPDGYWASPDTFGEQIPGPPVVYVTTGSKVGDKIFGLLVGLSGGAHIAGPMQVGPTTYAWSPMFSSAEAAGTNVLMLLEARTEAGASTPNHFGDVVATRRQRAALMQSMIDSRR